MSSSQAGPGLALGLGGPQREQRSVSPELVQNSIDAAANFNLYSVPQTRAGNPVIRGRSNSGVIGWNIHERLHRFLITTTAPTSDSPLKAINHAGEEVGSFSHRWMLIPDDFSPSPDLTPPETVFDASRSQRFVMLNSICRFRDGEDGFRAFGTGHTLPSRRGGSRQVLAMAVGTILEGFGKFAGLNEGTFCYCGALDPEKGFTGSVLLRVMDREQVFHSNVSLPAMQSGPQLEPDVTWILFRGQAIPNDPVSPNIGPGGQPVGLVVEQGLRLLEVDCTARGHTGLRTTMTVGPNIGRITARVIFNPETPGGSALQPIPFLADDEFVWTGRSGERLSSFNANSTEGRVFTTRVAGQAAIRFGGIGEVLSGTGPFQGIEGLMTDNSVVVFNPHVSASLYLLRLHDPDGRFRGRGDTGRTANGSGSGVS